MFYKPTPKQILELRNEIFLEQGIPSLNKNGFEKSPFSTAWNSRNNHNDYAYELCRLTSKKEIEIVTTNIIRGELWIQIYLNIFSLTPEVNSINELQRIDGLNYHLPPNSNKLMRLRSGDYKGIPLFYMLFYPEHKIGKYYTKNGFDKQIKKLGNLIEKDMLNINSFIKRWHELYKPNIVNWNGKIINE